MCMVQYGQKYIYNNLHGKQSKEWPVNTKRQLKYIIKLQVELMTIDNEDTYLIHTSEL